MQFKQNVFLYSNVGDGDTWNIPKDNVVREISITKTSMKGDVNMVNGKSRMVVKGGPDNSSLVDAQSTINKLIQDKTK